MIWNATLAEQARRLGEAWHDARLAELVARVRSRLPLHDRADASATLARACEEFECDAGVRVQLAELLLVDSLGWLQFVPALAA